MKCSKCGNEIQEDEKFCGVCGAKQKLKFDINEVVNSQDMKSSSNKVAYIAKGWALQVKKRGDNFAIIAVIICIIMGIAMQANSVYNDNTPYILFYIFYAVISFIIIEMFFNTVAFVIRMGAEIIQLLEDIKTKEQNEKE